MSKAEEQRELDALRQQTESFAGHGAVLSQVLGTVVSRIFRIEHSLGPMLLSQKQLLEMQAKLEQRAAARSPKRKTPTAAAPAVGSPQAVGAVRAAVGQWPTDDLGALPGVDAHRRSLGEAGAGLSHGLMALWAQEEARQGRLREAVEQAAKACAKAAAGGPLLWGAAWVPQPGESPSYDGGVWWARKEGARRAVASLVLPAGDGAEPVPEDGPDAVAAASRLDLFDAASLDRLLGSLSASVDRCLSLQWPMAVLSRRERGARIAVAAAARAEAGTTADGSAPVAVARARELGAKALPAVSASGLRRELERVQALLRTAGSAVGAAARCEGRLATLHAGASAAQVERLAGALDASSAFLLRAAKASADAGGDRDRRLNELERRLLAVSQDDGRLAGLDARMRALAHDVSETKEGLSVMQAELVDRASKRELEEALKTITEGLRDGVGADEMRRRLGALANLVDAKADESELLRLQQGLSAALARLRELSQPQKDIEALLSTRRCMSCGRPLPPDAQDLSMSAMMGPTPARKPNARRRRGRAEGGHELMAPVGGAALPGSTSGLRSSPHDSQLRHVYGGSTTRNRHDQTVASMTSVQPRPKGRNPLNRSSVGLPSVTGVSAMGQHAQDHPRGGRAVGRRGSGGGYVWPAMGTEGDPAHPATAPGGLDGWAAQSLPVLPHSGSAGLGEEADAASSFGGSMTDLRVPPAPAVVMPSALKAERTTPAQLRRQAGEELAAATSED
ncbi:hypothetical protein FNF28_04579 [Cafeteria roenbergensis]|uniref:Uncharacterized protein n=1 Tax=Cafeteria roenbergensis TaxID=33653 RepID=A0A5A8DBR3_CAFRO|nr:hypothetical protein FNF28_04579 [Cafeteria roenbergensis]